MERARAHATGRSDQEFLDIADKEIKTLQKEMEEDKETFNGLLITAESERNEAQQAEQEAKAQVHSLRQRVDALQRQVKQSADRAVPVSLPNNLQDLQDWC